MYEHGQVAEMLIACTTDQAACSATEKRSMQCSQASFIHQSKTIVKTGTTMHGSMCWMPKKNDAETCIRSSLRRREMVDAGLQRQLEGKAAACISNAHAYATGEVVKQTPSTCMMTWGTQLCRTLVDHAGAKRRSHPAALFNEEPSKVF